MKRKTNINVLIFSLLMANVFAQVPNQDTVVGVWFNAEKDGKVTIYKQGDKYFGKVTWGKNPRKDIENPDPKMRNNEVVGTVILKEFKFTGKAWEDGTIYDPKNGKTYSCIIKSKNANTLEIRGFIGISLLGRTTVWTRTT